MSISKSEEQIEMESVKKVFPSFILFKKTLFNEVGTLPKFIWAIIIMFLLGPLFVIISINPSLIDYSDESIFDTGLGFVYLMLTTSIVFSIIISVSTAPMISFEIREGTMLMLVSKPISRANIFLSKFLAVFTFGFLINLISLSITCLLTYARYPFYDVLPFFLVILVYSLIILVFFECLTMGLSCILRKPRTVLIIPVGFIIFLFLVFLMFKPLLLLGGETNLYEKYHLYIFDLSYHFANAYFLLVDNLLNIEPSLIFVMYNVAEYDDGFGNIVYTNYVSPIFSLILLISIAVLAVSIGYFYFKKRDIS